MTRLPPRSTLFPYTTLFRSTTRRNSLPVSTPRWIHGAGDRENASSSSLTPAKLTRKLSTGLPSVTSSPKRSEEHTSELQSRRDLVCRLLLEKKKKEHYDMMY